MADARGLDRLIIMVKEPRLGAVKTRLAAEIGASSAVRFYRSVTAHLIRRLAFDPRWRTVLAVTPDAAVASRSWPSGLARMAQGRGDIGERMERLLRSQAPRPAILIGSDIPAIEASHIAKAFGLLRRNDAVFGPAEDGGFWLAGLKALPRLSGVFDNVRWSSAHALSDTLANLSGRKVGFVARLSDVDDLEAYRSTGAYAARIVLSKG